MHTVAIIIGLVIAFAVAMAVEVSTGLLSAVDSRSDVESIAAFLGFVMLWMLCSVGVYAVLERLSIKARQITNRFNTRT